MDEWMDRKTSLMWYTVYAVFLREVKKAFFYEYSIHILCAVKTVISKNTGRDHKSLNFGQCKQT